MVVSTFLGGAIIFAAVFVAMAVSIAICLAAGLTGLAFTIKASLMTGLLAGILIWVLDWAIFKLLRRPSDAFVWRVPLKYWTLLAPLFGVGGAIAFMLGL